MTSLLGKYVRKERVRQNLNVAELARKMNYTNINRGMRRIIDLERENETHPEVLEKIIDALELDRDIIANLIQQDEEEQLRKFDEWVNTPIKWHLIIRWIPAVYGEKDIPGYINTEEEAIEYARSIAIEYKSMIWLVLSREVNIHIDSDGNIKLRNEVTIEYSWLPRTRIK